jgi:predicted nucleic acid-binding protein
MILYLDTSALVKLYVEEVGSSAVAAEVDRAEAVVTARVTYAEARAAFARHRREGGLTPTALRRVVRDLDGEWGTYNVVEVGEPLVRRAGALAERHALRGYDAIQLAAALEIKATGADLQFASFDDRLSRAAQRERVRLTEAR